MPEPPIAEPIPEPLPTGPVKAALLLPLTGQAGDLGQDMLDAATMALYDVGESDMVLMPLDTGGTPEGAARAARQAIEQEAEIILGPLFAASTVAVAPVARASGLSVISFSNDARVADKDVYVLGFRPEEQVSRVVRHALARGLGRIAALAPNDAYGTRALAAWRAAIAEYGGASEPLYAFYPEDQNETARIIRELTRYDQRKAALERQKAALAGRSDAASVAERARLEELDTLGEPPFDAILIADHGSRLRSAVALLAYYDVDRSNTQFLGTMLWKNDPRLLMEPELQGGWIATVSPRDDEAFLGNYESFFSRRPNALAGLAYDATALAAVVARIDRGFPLEQLTDPGGFFGRAGIFRLRTDGLGEHGLAVVQVSEGRTLVVDDAPDSFTESALVQ